MTESELKIELMCYKEHINPNCDIDRMSLKEMEEFYQLYIASETYQASLKKGAHKIKTI